MKKLVLIILTCLPYIIYPQINLDSTLVAYYPFSGNAYDASGNGNHGTVYGATLTTDRFGNPNSAYSFNGSDNYILIPVNINYTTLPQFTMVCWASPSNIPSNPRMPMIAHGDGGYDRTMAIDSRSGTTGYSAFRGNLGWGVFGSFPAVVGQWDMITVAYDQTIDSVTLYKNTNSMAGATSLGMGLNHTFIGGHPNNGKYFDGVIDEVRLYDRILTDDEIMALFEQSYAVFTASDDSICEGDVVSFTDQTPGNVISWDWTFEGGTPATSTAQHPSVTYNTMGTYDVQLIASNGSYSDTLLEEEYITVAMTPSPVISGLSNPCSGYTEYYMTEGNPFNTSTYDWEVSGGTIINGAGTYQISVEWGDPGSGYVIVTEDNGNCSMTTELYEIIIDECTSIVDNYLQKINVYPNPFSKKFIVEISHLLSQNTFLAISNTNGQQLITQPITESQSEIDINHLPAGIYIVKVWNDRDVMVQKVIKR